MKTPARDSLLSWATISKPSSRTPQDSYNFEKLKSTQIEIAMENPG
jgi:hypothetical protein